MEDSTVSVEVPPVTPEAGAAATKAATKAAASDAGVGPPAPAVDGAAGPPPLPEEKLEGKELLEALKKQVGFVFSCNHRRRFRGKAEAADLPRYVGDLRRCYGIDRRPPLGALMA